MKYRRLAAIAAALFTASGCFAAFPASAAEMSELIDVSSFVIHDENFVHLSKGTYLRDVSYLFDEQDKAPTSPDNMNVGSEVLKATSKANWTPNQQTEYGAASFYMDMGANYVITAIAFLDTNGTPVWTVSDGEPFSWHAIAEQKMDYYNSWRVIKLDKPEPTRYLHFSSDYCDSGVSELAIYGYKKSELTAAQISKTAPKEPLYPISGNETPAGNRVGFNAFIDDPMTAMMSAGTVREYHNFSWMLDSDCKVKFTQGTWGDMDSYYKSLHDRGINVIPCIQGGSTAVSGRIGKHLVTRFLFYSTMLTIVTMFLSQPFFRVPGGEAALTQREVSGVLDFFLDVIPGDILSPFIQGDFTQLIIVALILGNAFLIAGPKAQALSSLVDEAYTVGLLVAEWIGDLSPGFVALLIILGIQKDTIHMLLGIWKPILLVSLFAMLALFLKMLRASLLFRVPVRTLCLKMKESFILSLRTFSIETPYSASQECCEKKLGISSQLTSYSLPIGLICFMPVSTFASTILTLYAAECYDVPVSFVWMIMALFLAVTLGAAGPPTAGIGILTYTVMFSKLGIPTQALTLVLAGDILMGFVIYPVNQALLQLELVFEADKLDVLNHKILRKPVK